MGKMINGEWTTQWYGHQKDGEFVREDTVFHGTLEKSADAKFPVQQGRYHLFVSYACPWASRVLMTRQLLALQDFLPFNSVHPFMDDDGWHFDEETHPEPLYGSRFLRQLYKRAADDYTGRVTVPVLWDTQNETIVNNESRDILEMLDTISSSDITLYPTELRDEIDAMIDANYNTINNGVYRCGFAGSQHAYDRAVRQLFDRLTELESLLSTRRYLCGSHFTAADVCLFPTLVRFDPVYHNHFKCNLRMLKEFPNLWSYTREIYQMPGIASTVDFVHIKEHYFTSHDTINPKRIIAAGPIIDMTAPHDRARLPGGFAYREEVAAE